MSKGFQYRTNCIVENGRLIQEMEEKSRQVARRTFLRYVDKDSLAELAKDLGYAEHSRKGLTLKDDWHVRYYVGTFDREPCAWLDHSSVFYIFLGE